MKGGEEEDVLTPCRGISGTPVKLLAGIKLEAMHFPGMERPVCKFSLCSVKRKSSVLCIGLKDTYHQSDPGFDPQSIFFMLLREGGNQTEQN